MSMFEPIAAPGAGAPGQREANYIVYLLDGVGRIRGAEWIAAADDSEALAQARLRALATPCELWQRNRKVARLPCS